MRDPGNEVVDLFGDTAAILNSVVSNAVMGYSGGKLMLCPLSIK